MTGAVVLTVSVGDTEELNEELVVVVVVSVVGTAEVLLAGVKDAQSLVRVEDVTVVDPGVRALLVNEDAEVSELLIVVVLLMSVELLDVEERDVDIVLELEPPGDLVSVEEEAVDITVPELHIDEVEWIIELALLSEETIVDVAVCDVVRDPEKSELVSVVKDMGDVATLEPDIEVVEELSELVLLGEEGVTEVAVCDEGPELREPENVVPDEEEVVNVAILELEYEEEALIEEVLAVERVAETRVCDEDPKLVLLPKYVPDD
ncbi:hypothetical protein VPNG_05180 [Cytospora leucostoma]|uniref:Uncharacterized protein n=1 Tax=Cytospora leucostoma TaxID=1230097 RepID=A0A423X7G4_9PEZI|nr:hypothetical protein VPNG_05180 [Cytospora leucostoma]